MYGVQDGESWGEASGQPGVPFSHWREKLGTTYGLACERHRGQHCDPELDEQDVGELTIARVRMSGLTIEPRCRFEPAEDRILIKWVVNGAAMFEQNAGQRRFNAGSLVVADPARPFVEFVEDEVQLLVVSCPKSALRERGYPCDLNHLIVPNMLSPDVRIVQEMIRLVACHNDALQESTKKLLSGHLIDLMDVVVTDGNMPRPGRNSEMTRYRVKRYIAQHLGEEGLDAATISRSVNLSVSYLNRLFRAEDTSLMRYLWRERLQRAHQMLTTREHDYLRVEEIAWRCGFASAAHFSRLFRHRYGSSPKELRDLRS